MGKGWWTLTNGEELRQHYLETLKPNLTVADVDRLTAWRRRLTVESEGLVPQKLA